MYAGSVLVYRVHAVRDRACVRGHVRLRQYTSSNTLHKYGQPATKLIHAIKH